MLRLFNHFSGKFNRPVNIFRCFTTETKQSFDELDREKKLKIFELEKLGFNASSEKVPAPIE